MRVLTFLLVLSFACGDDAGTTDDPSTDGITPRDMGGARDQGSVDAFNPLTDPTEGPAAGNPEGDCAIPAEAGPEDTSSPDHVVGTVCTWGHGPRGHRRL